MHEGRKHIDKDDGDYGIMITIADEDGPDETAINTTTTMC